MTGAAVAAVVTGAAGVTGAGTGAADESAGAAAVVGACRPPLVPRPLPVPHAASASTETTSTVTIRRARMAWVTIPAVALSPTCLWRATPALVVALDDRFGEPVDAYVNGSQVWLRDDGPGGTTLEWRLHPVAGYRRPAKVGTYEIFAATALALATGADPPAPLDQLWDGLECFPAYGDEMEPATLATAAAEALGIPPDASGLVDHGAIGDAWERSSGGVSIVSALLDQLGR